MAQQTDGHVGTFDEAFEDPNAGVSASEPKEAGPGVVGKLLTTFSNVKQRVAGHGSTPTTPSGVQAQQHHEVGGVPHEQQSPAREAHIGAAAAGDAVGAGGPVGDGVETSRGLSSGGSSRSAEAAVSSPGGGNVHHLRDGASPASPKLPHRDFAERIIDKLPGSHANPYSVGQTASPRATNPYTEGGAGSSVPTSPSAQRSSSTPSSPGILGKMKNLFTGQKPSRGTATENATTGTAGTTGTQQPMTQGYAQSPIPEKGGDILEKAKEKLGHKGPDVGSAETWPSPSKPDISSIPSATRTDAEGKPIEGPTQPKSEDTKKEGLMTKIMDKFHIHEKSSSPRATATDTGTGTAATIPSQETGIPTPTAGAPSTTIGTATGPKEN